MMLDEEMKWVSGEGILFCCCTVLLTLIHCILQKTVIGIHPVLYEYRTKCVYLDTKISEKFKPYIA
jgi:hypothetical protein